MEIIYKWFIKDYENNPFWWIALLNDTLYLKNWFTEKIDWKYSDKKKKYYSKIDYKDNRWRFEFIVFKNNYIILWYTKIYEAQEWDISF